MLENLRRKSNPHTVVIGISTAIMENNAKASQKKLKLNLPYDPVILLLGIQQKKMKSASQGINSRPKTIHYNQGLESVYQQIHG